MSKHTLARLEISNSIAYIGYLTKGHMKWISKFLSPVLKLRQMNMSMCSLLILNT